MKLAELVSKYATIKDSAELVEEICRALESLKPDYAVIAAQVHDTLERSLQEKLPMPSNIDSAEAYNAYYSLMLEKIEPHYKRMADRKIHKGDRVRIVKAMRNNYKYNAKAKYYHGTKIADIPIGSEWTVARVKRVYGGYYTATSYLLNTRQVLGRNTAFRNKEIEKVVNGMPASIEGFVQKCLTENGVELNGSANEVMAVLEKQLLKTNAPSLRKCLYTIAATMFPEYRSVLRSRFAEARW